MKPEPQLEPIAWLSLARAQSVQLGESRVRAARPSLRRSGREQATSRLLLRPVLTATVFALAVLVLVSGAWAWVASRGAQRPAHSEGVSAAPFTPTRSMAASGASVSTQAVTVKPPVNEPPLRGSKPWRTPRKHIEATPPSPREERRDAEEPYGDVVFGKPPVKQPPLFTTEEYKSRGILAP